MTELRPRVYVASLADYNAGRLHGAWIDADHPAEELSDQITAMLERSSEPAAEDWAVHDQYNFAGIQLSEVENLETISRLARGLVAHGPAFGAFAIWHGLEQASADSFEQHYRGHWDTAESFADEWLRDMGADEYLERTPTWIRPYLKLDVEGFARDLELAGDMYFSPAGKEGGVYVFDAIAQ